MARTAGEQISWALLAVAGAALALQPQGCSGGDPTQPTPDPEAVAQVLAAVGPEVVLPTLRAVDDALAALGAAIDAWDAALASGGDGAAEQAAARDAFAVAMGAWQRAELMQIGPAGSSLSAVAGADLRDEIYSWPTVNPCRVDQETAEETWDSSDFFTANLVNSYGLDALEYLLHAGPGNECPGQVDPNANGAWDALGPDGVARNRANFATALTAGASGVVDQLIGAWEGDFGVQFADPGGPSSPYEDGQQALNAVLDALFYLELVTKDRKVGQPLGVVPCAVQPCEVEGLPSDLGADYVAANIAGFELLFTGAAGRGMDDLVRDQGHPDVAEALVARVSDAMGVVDALGQPLAAAVATDAPEAHALLDALKAVTDLVKGDLATILVLEVPSEAAGDND